MKKLVIFYSFIVTSFLTLTAIFSANTYIELISAIFFSFISLYFTILMLPRKQRALSVANTKQTLEIKPELIKNIESQEYDPERRKFLKLISAAGGAIFLTAIFTRKAEASFFGSMPGPGTVAIKNTQGVAIDPAEKKPTDGYSITEIDDSGTDAYYGFLNKDGGWFILKDSNGIYRYAKGASSFSSNWTGRSGLTYDYFNVVF